MAPPKRDDEGRRLGSKEKTRIKKRLMGERALADLKAWAEGAKVLEPAE
jgi:methylenetetrahydrofolate--tRNA-(uracil-5-)-methyltransferase